MLAIKPADGKPFLRTSPELEREIGDKPGKLLLQLDYWIRIGKNLIDGKWWTYQSTRDIQEKAFPGWALSTINRTIKRLETLGLIEIANHNKAKYDKTRWFALKPEGVAQLQSIILSEDEPRSAQNEPRSEQNGTGSTQNDTHPAQNGTTIPETPTTNSALNPALNSTSTPSAHDDAGDGFKSTSPEDCIESKPEIPEVRSIPTGDEGEMDIMESLDSQPSPHGPSPVPSPSPRRHRWGEFFTYSSNQELEDMEKQHGAAVVDAWIAQARTMKLDNPPGYVIVALRKGTPPPVQEKPTDDWRSEGLKYISGPYASIIHH